MHLSGLPRCLMTRPMRRWITSAARLRFAFRHFPLTGIHPHALAAATAAEAADLQDRSDLGLDVARFNRDRAATGACERVRRDVESGMESGEVRGTPTLFIDGAVHRGACDAATLLEALAR
jgi:protein-disulfide isomerase